MSLLFRSLVGSVIRSALLTVSGYLVRKEATYIEAGVLATLAVAWSLYQKYQAHQAILTALDLPAGASLDTLAEKQRRP
jgi:hypothetical protein